MIDSESNNDVNLMSGIVFDEDYFVNNDNDNNSFSDILSDESLTASLNHPKTLAGIKRDGDDDLLSDTEVKLSIYNILGESYEDNSNITTYNNARINHLMRFSESLQLALNAGNFDLSRRLFTDACMGNVELTTPTGPRVEGIVNAINYLENMYNTMPDMVLVIKPAKRYHRVLFSKLYADGTLMGTHLTSAPTMPTQLPPAIYEQYKYLASAGKPILIRSKSYLYIVLNKDMTHIERFVVVNRSRELVDLSDCMGGARHSSGDGSVGGV